MSDRCADCRFAGPEFNFEQHECRRHAPVMVEVAHSEDIRKYVPKWPIVTSRDWCGDFQGSPMRNGTPNAD